MVALHDARTRSLLASETRVALVEGDGTVISKVDAKRRKTPTLKDGPEASRPSGARRPVQLRPLCLPGADPAALRRMADVLNAAVANSFNEDERAALAGRLESVRRATTRLVEDSTTAGGFSTIPAYAEGSTREKVASDMAWQRSKALDGLWLPGDDDGHCG